MSPAKTKAPAPAPRSNVTAAATAGTPVPTRMPEGVGVAPPAGAPAAPVLAPPDTAAAAMTAQAAAEGIAAWQNVTIGGLWTSNDVSNAWAFLNGVGWRRISPANAVAHHAMLQLVRLARDANLTIQCDEDGSVIHSIYVW